IGVASAPWVEYGPTAPTPNTASHESPTAGEPAGQLPMSRKLSIRQELDGLDGQRPPETGQALRLPFGAGYGTCGACHVGAQIQSIWGDRTVVRGGCALMLQS